MEAATAHRSGDRPTLGRSPLARLPDPVLRYGLTVVSAGILVLIVYFFYSLASESLLQRGDSEAGAALAVALRADPRPTIVDRPPSTMSGRRFSGISGASERAVASGSVSCWGSRASRCG